MRKVLLTLALLGMATGVASADPANLGGGVLAAHYVPELPYSTDPPTGGWCVGYGPYAIGSLGDVMAQIDVVDYAPVVWYVIAAWEMEAKIWCGTEFGFGDYDAARFSVAEAAPCFPDEGLEIPTAMWPGPGEGTAFVTTTAPWEGNWVPVYYFGGYAYGYGLSTVIPIDVDPPTGFVGFGNCEAPPAQFTVNEIGRGAMGINTMGVVPQFEVPEPEACCFDTGECILYLEPDCLAQGGIFYGGPCEPNPCPPPEGACCVIGVCSINTQEECDLVGGEWLGMGTTCEPNPCPAVCCIDPATQYHTCIITLEDDCMAQGGYWHPEEGSCDPNPCTIYTPTENTSWGQIKEMYR